MAIGSRARIRVACPFILSHNSHESPHYKNPRYTHVYGLSHVSYYSDPAWSRNSLRSLTLGHQRNVNSFARGNVMILPLEKDWLSNSSSTPVKCELERKKATTGRLSILHTEYSAPYDVQEIWKEGRQRKMIFAQYALYIFVTLMHVDDRTGKLNQQILGTIKLSNLCTAIIGSSKFRLNCPPNFHIWWEIRL